MKKLFSILFFSSIIQISFAGELVLEGIYFGKNLFIQNPESAEGTFCTNQVIVNENAIPFDQASAFEIRLDELGLTIGDSVTIVIIHEDDCKPKLLNPEIVFESTYIIVDIQITNDGILTWTTKEEKNKLCYTVEQYRWNKWVKIGEVDGKGSPVENKYEFKVSPHFGENCIRVTQTDHRGKKRPSPEVIFISSTEEIQVTQVTYPEKQIHFSSETLYELYDEFGNVLKRGFANQIDCSNLKTGIYYLNYDNKSVKIVFKKSKVKFTK